MPLEGAEGSRRFFLKKWAPLDAQFPFVLRQVTVLARAKSSTSVKSLEIINKACYSDRRPAKPTPLARCWMQR
jgi:hypothetical protein